jgi:regulator of sigma E protease
MVRDVGNLLSAVGKIVTGAVSTRNLSGPLTIAQVASDSAEVGYEYYVSVLAMLSVGLAVLNLLPVPVLDGGHVVYASVELVTGRAVPERVQLVGLQIGLAFVASLTVLALYNDVMRLLPVSPN